MQPTATVVRGQMIDHVFRWAAKDIAIAGGFNGDGIATVGTFRDEGKLDTTGNGKTDR